MRVDSQENIDDIQRRQKLGRQANAAAVSFILDKYRDEYEAQLQKERLQRGLLRTANAKSPEQLAEQLRKIKEKAAAVEREYAAALAARSSVAQ